MSNFRMPSARQRRLLAKAQTQYAESLTWADGFLKGRGLTRDVAQKWGLGVVTSPLPSHERFTGQLCIPYLNKAGVIGLKFRCIQPHDCKESDHRKYDQPDTQVQYLYNVLALETESQVVHVTEGELDTIVLSEVLGEPVVGVPGVDHWHPHWAAHFAGFDRVVVWPDGDKAGKGMASLWTKKVGAELIGLPDGHDVTSLFVEQGGEALQQLYRGDD